jgi:hypothetical protein
MSRTSPELLGEVWEAGDRAGVIALVDRICSHWPRRTSKWQPRRSRSPMAAKRQEARHRPV